jgi:nucleotide-binding universal stress UspA family protein
MKPVLLATDGSSSAAEATLEAVELAKAFGAPLVAIAVAHVTIPAYGFYGYGEILTDLMKIEKEHVEKVLEQVEGAARAAGVPCEVLSATGPVVDQIVKVARAREARVIVMGAHGWGPLRKIVYGSVSTGVLHEAPCPVLVVRGDIDLLAEEPVFTNEAVAH